MIFSHTDVVKENRNEVFTALGAVPRGLGSGITVHLLMSGTHMIITHGLHSNNL